MPLSYTKAGAFLFPAMENQFRIYGEIDLSKSLAATTNGAAKDILIKGRVLNSRRDFSGETPIIPEMDWSYFDRAGFVKYEHDPVVTVAENGKRVVTKSVPDPSNIIGVPLRRENVGDKETLLEASLFPDMEKAQDVARLMKALDEHNRRYPTKRRTIGFSIEGSYVKKSKDGSYAGRVFNVAITPNPQDESTYAEFAARSNTEMAKSLAAGYVVSPAEMAGGAALKKESLEGSHTKKGGKPMKFASKQKAYEHFRSKGMSDADAKKEIETLYGGMAKSRTEGSEALGKSLTTAVESFKKSVAAITEMSAALDTRANEIAGFDAQIKKSVNAMNEHQEVDGAQWLANQGNAIVTIGGMVRESQLAIAKSLVAMSEGMGELASMVKGIAAQVVEVQEQVELNGELTSAVETGIKKGQTGMISKGLDSFKVADPAAAGAPPKEEDLVKSIPTGQVEKYLVDKGAELSEKGETAKASEYFAAQSAFRESGSRGLSKSMAAEIVASLKKS